MIVDLPINKSLANRILIRQALCGDRLLPISVSMPQDVQILHKALQDIEQNKPEIDVDNCGTAMRFLTAYLAQYEGKRVTLEGCERMHQRPIGQLVEALQSLGASITYLQKEGFPPLLIEGKRLDKTKPIILNDPLSTQFISALLLIGANVQTNCQSPYITMTQQVLSGQVVLEKDWTSASYWYEYLALHDTQQEIFFPHLSNNTTQPDQIVADVFEKAFGIKTTCEKEGCSIAKFQKPHAEKLEMDFQNCPDLYPTIAITCQRLNIPLFASGTEALPYKESNRLESCEQRQTNHDHRMAMTLLMADYAVDDTDCIAKSYPAFMRQFQQICPKK